MNYNLDMKITIDTKNNTVKVGNKSFDELDEVKRNVAESFIRDFLHKNTQLTDYEEDCMWMSYRYCIGRHTIASSMHAYDIWKNCKGRMSEERQLFTAYDINREIEHKLAFGYNFPSFCFPITSLNRIYTTAVDIVCQFIEDYNIKSKSELCKYKNIHVKLSDNDRGYSLETVTWEEWLRPQVLKICQDFWKNDAMSEDFAWKLFKRWQNKEDLGNDVVPNKFKELTNGMPNIEYFYMHDFEDLFIWNDLVHCFDYEHYHKSILKNGEEVEWFWSWTPDIEEREDGKYYRKEFGYRKIRVPVKKWNGTITTWIPNESIEKDLY